MSFEDRLREWSKRLDQLVWYVENTNENDSFVRAEAALRILATEVLAEADSMAEVIKNS